MEQVFVGVFAFLILATPSIQANRGYQDGIRNGRSLFSMFRLGKEALRGQMARNRLLLGTTAVKILRDQDYKLGATKTFLKRGDWGDVVRDFNSISPTDVTSKFKDQIRVGHVGDRTIMIQQRGFGDKPTLSIFKPNSNEIEAEEIIVYSLENMRVYGGY